MQLPLSAGPAVWYNWRMGNDGDFSSGGAKTVRLVKGREKSVLRRHPWIFSGAVDESRSDSVSPGETVAVAAADGTRLGWGAFSPASQIRVRMLSFDPKRAPDGSFVADRVASSVARRADLLSSGRTNAARVVNAESDGLPGVVADCYAGHVVCQFTSAFAELRKQEIARALMDSCPGCKSVSERADVDVRRKEGLACRDGLSVLAGEEPPELIEISEGKVRLFVDVRKGHKTGFYLDQRDAREAVGAFARGRTVLNCFCFTGGFGLHAAAGGAGHVTQVDVSADALALARRNAELNFGAGCGMDFVEADVFKYLRSCRDAGRKFDMIVLDPPKFAETKSQVMKAARGYKDINLLAMKLLAPGGILATFSCSGAVTPDLFDKILAEAAEDARRDFQIAARTRQAEDHPVALSFPEGLYLKGVVLRAV